MIKNDRGPLAPDQKDGLPGLCEAFETITDPLDAERWTSEAIGRMWELRRFAQRQGVRDWAFSLGAPVAREMGRIGGAGAKGLLLTWAYLDSGRFGSLCDELAAGIDDDGQNPSWTDELGGTTLTRAVAAAEIGTGQVVGIDVGRSHQYQQHSIFVYIDERRGGIVKHLALLQPLDVIDRDRDGPGLTRTFDFQPVEIDEASRRIRRAIEATDRQLRHPTVNGYKQFRALTLARIRPYAQAEEAA